MRTQRTRSPQSRFLMASTALARAASFSRGATESSRSRNVMSAAIVGPLARNRSLDPGTERQERRGRSRVRSDMPEMLRGRLRRCVVGRQVAGGELLGGEAGGLGRVAGDE